MNHVIRMYRRQVAIGEYQQTRKFRRLDRPIESSDLMCPMIYYDTDNSFVTIATNHD